MVKLYSIELFYKESKVKILKCAHDLKSFGYFQRNSVREFMVFTGKIIVERTSNSQRASVKEQDYMCHVYVSSDGLSGVAITDSEYNQRVAFNMLNKILEEFKKQVSVVQYTSQDPSSYSFALCDSYLKKYQNPKEADAMTKLENNLDDTKIIVYETLEKVLKRGEKLEDLIAQSNSLSASSQLFSRTAKKTNSSCCNW